MVEYRVEYKNHVIIKMNGKYIPMAESAINLGYSYSLEGAMLACDKYEREKNKKNKNP